eukprot:10343821-Alexandrium_andersonii.AAC.1
MIAKAVPYGARSDRTWQALAGDPPMSAALLRCTCRPRACCSTIAAHKCGRRGDPRPATSQPRSGVQTLEARTCSAAPSRLGRLGHLGSISDDSHASGRGRRSLSRLRRSRASRLLTSQ